MQDFFLWFTELDNSKMFALVLFFTTYVGILLYVYTGRRRTERLESYRFMPLNEGHDDAPKREDNKDE
ncbi:MAG: CcoQ/FixQ family Cbb3-type cytochrome c oxidase assembly chaperone [Pseudomonadota bacterium]|uniref:Cbb3-type cytochrome oxidase component FixQ n=1 Tax=Thiohalospira halophila DSM 15071 TaxID=1123397 RepID=A0A1I1T5P0_9GAMM|nr:CcoQ/FixQ family Cbb3-type cytochrome c oxidase assembly chaperone [Thiohalospira halophila]SFD53965.1 Cbb3-type cytochrome oxidase component FixQ [Thiohalospira halophila DSM 15071]